jgi:Zn-dependent peptidase ImmA (M78 family)/DNA-binding XRE family transcriptional regulator
MSEDKIPFDAKKLRAARKMRAWSMQELADRLASNGVNLTRQALNKYELGSSSPTDRTIKGLARTLDVPLNFFSKRKEEVELKNISFRKLESYSAKESARIEEIVKSKLERYIELEKLLGIPPEFKDPKIGENIIDLDSIDLAANALRAAWGLGNVPIASTRELLENNHIKVIDVESTVELDGFSATANGDYPVVVLNSTKLKNYTARKRWTTLHELGHLLLDLNHLSHKQQERYCHYFAGALLFPRDIFIRVIGEKRNKLSLQELASLKQEYGISMQAIVYRAKELGVISQNYYRQFFFMFNQMGYKVNEPVEYNGKESAKRFDQLLFRALSEKVITLEKAAELKEMTKTEFENHYPFR